MDINQPLTLTVEQTAKLLGIGRSTAYELVRTGDIPSLRLGRRIVVPIAQLADRLGVGLEAVHTAPAEVSQSDVAGPADDGSSTASPGRQGIQLLTATQLTLAEA
jgi:excisionase family DNA binding protein